VSESSPALPDVQRGQFSEQSLHAELGQNLAGRKPGRESDQETILFWHRGLSSSDIALGHALLQKAPALNVGQTLRFARSNDCIDGMAE
jgi:alanine dehydrogenase